MTECETTIRRGMLEWCEGRPLIGRRALEPEERRRLDADLRKVHAVSVFSIAALCISTAAIVKFSLISNVVQFNRFQLCSLALAAIGIPAEILLLRDAWWRAVGLAADLTADVVKRFDNGADVDTQSGLGPIEVLPASGRILTLNGAPIGRWMQANVNRVARHPEFASIAAQWLDPLVRTTRSEVYTGQRAMTRGEREELQRHATSVWRRRAKIALGASLWLGLGVDIGSSFDRFATVNTRDIATLISLALCAICFTWWAVARSKRLRKDLHSGRVLIMRVAPLLADAAEQTESVYEVLPFSRKMWSEAGAPTDWRTSGV